MHQPLTEAALRGEYQINGEEIQVHSDTIKGMRVFYLQSDRYVEMVYRNDDTEYIIMMEGEIADAVQIGDTLLFAIAQG